MSTRKKPYPVYDGKYKGRKAGMYLGLFHGFRNEKERAEKQDWGAQGPMFGPLQYAHTTYACEVKIKFINPKDAEQYGLEDDTALPIIDGCIGFHGMMYGDWTVFNVTKGGKVFQGI